MFAFFFASWDFRGQFGLPAPLTGYEYYYYIQQPAEQLWLTITGSPFNLIVCGIVSGFALIGIYRVGQLIVAYERAHKAKKAAS